MNRSLSVRRIIFNAFLLMAAISLQSYFVEAQTTEFTCQGSLKNGGTPANGNFDFEFALFDAVSGRAQVGSTATFNNVAVTNGLFSISPDFGGQFSGANLSAAN